MNLKCDNCGNEYDKAFQVILSGREHTFDSFECAINVLAPQCEHCAGLTHLVPIGVDDFH